VLNSSFGRHLLDSRLVQVRREVLSVLVVNDNYILLIIDGRYPLGRHLLLLYYNAGLVQFIDLHQVLVPYENDLLELDLLRFLHLVVRGLRDLVQTLLTNEDRGSLIHALLEFVVGVITPPSRGHLAQESKVMQSWPKKFAGYYEMAVIIFRVLILYY
jgi:hypothetical protein